MVIKPLFISALEVAIQQYLAMADNAERFLEPLAGKVIALSLQPFNQRIILSPTTETIVLLEYYDESIDTTLSGSIPAFMAMSLSDTPMNSIFSGEIHIEGDMEVGKSFQQLFAQLDIKLETKVASFIGETLANKLGSFTKSSYDWGQETIKTFKLNSTEFLQEESRDVPAKAEIAIFYRQVDTLRADYDRLMARVQRLQNKN